MNRAAGVEVAVDLGTAFTRVCRSGHAGLVAEEPSLVRVRPEVGLAEAVGRRALDEGVPGVLRTALHGGVIVDLDAAVMLLQKLLWRVRGSAVVRPSVLLCAPSDACPTELAGLAEAGRRSGASSVRLVPEPLAAAVGGGLDLASPHAQLVVDVGEGVTDVGLIKAGRLDGSWAARVGCGALRLAAARSIADRCGLELSAAELERHISVALRARAETMLVTGRDRARGVERQQTISTRDLSDAIEPVLDQIGSVLRTAWSGLSPQTSCEVIESGVLMVGGGALVDGLRDRLAAETRLDVRVARDPLHAVIDGARVLAGR